MPEPQVPGLDGTSPAAERLTPEKCGFAAADEILAQGWHASGSSASAVDRMTTDGTRG